MAAVDDLDVLARQLGRRPRAFARVVVRCPWGRPAVTEQRPYTAAGEPFPTTFYLSCPQLVVAVSRIEAAGGVERFTALVETDPDLRADLDRVTLEQAALRTKLAAGSTGQDGGASLGTGIGGSRNPTQLKCLHAHVAYALAVPGYRLGGKMLAELDPLWPAEECCTA